MPWICDWTVHLIQVTSLCIMINTLWLRWILRNDMALCGLLWSTTKISEYQKLLCLCIPYSHQEGNGCHWDILLRNTEFSTVQDDVNYNTMDNIKIIWIKTHDHQPLYSYCVTVDIFCRHWFGYPKTGYAEITYSKLYVIRYFL